MAAIPRKRGNSWIYQTTYNGKRITFSLGSIPRSEANIAAGHLARILSAWNENVEPSPVSVKWVRSANPRILETLERAGIALRSEGISVSDLVTEFNSDYERKRELAERTVVRMRQYSQKLIDFFGDKPIDSLTSRDARRFLEYLQSEYPAEATWTKGLQRCKQVFNWAVEHDFIRKNPLRLLKGGRYENENRMEYVPVKVITEVLEEMPIGDEKVAVALARYGGLRIPSELSQLTWDRVNLVKKVMVVWDVKRERDKAVPIFPSLWEVLNQQFEKFGGDSNYVIVDASKRDPNVNLRKSLNTYVIRSGQTPWGKPFQNLRASCETDLLKQFPIHQVVKWIGNSSQVALRHYAMVTDQDIAAAAARPIFTDTSDATVAQTKANETKEDPFPTS